LNNYASESEKEPESDNPSGKKISPKTIQRLKKKQKREEREQDGKAKARLGKKQTCKMLTFKKTCKSKADASKKGIDQDDDDSRGLPDIVNISDLESETDSDADDNDGKQSSGSSKKKKNLSQPNRICFSYGKSKTFPLTNRTRTTRLPSLKVVELHSLKYLEK
jgi:hypothetical protein